jgi:hypothetical protein
MEQALELSHGLGSPGTDQLAPVLLPHLGFALVGTTEAAGSSSGTSCLTTERWVVAIFLRRRDSQPSSGLHLSSPSSH